MNRSKHTLSTKLSSPWQFRSCLALVVTLAGVQMTAHGAKILYHQNLGQRDTAKIADILVAQGHDVTIINENGGETLQTAVQFAAAGYQLLIVDEVVGSGSVGTRFKDSPIPVITSEAFLLRNDRLSFCTGSGPNTWISVGDAQAANATAGQIALETQINITAGGHPLAAGLSGMVQIFNTSIDTNVYPIPPENPGPQPFPGVITFASAANNLVPGVTKIAEVPGASDFYSLFVVEPGVTNAGGTTTNLARYIHLPWNDTLDGRVLQEPSFFLFEASVAYALGLNQPTKIRDLTESTVFAPTNKVISFKVDKMTAGSSAVASTAITMTVNGVNVSSDLVIADGGSTWNASYNKGFATNEVYTVIVSATAADGGFSARKMTFDTLGESYFTVEAEHYNYTETNTFAPGQFYQTPVLCQAIGGGVLNCYFDEISSNGVDRVKNNARQTVATPFNVEVYRYGHGITREENMDTYVSLDFTTQGRTAYVNAGIPDYDVRSITVNDWQNYTRTYPTGKFNIYLRMLSSKTNGSVQLDTVDDPVSPTTTNNLGTFVATGIGPQTVPLTDAGGNAKIVVELTSLSPTTMRLTQLAAGFHMQGYFVLVPTAAAVNEAPTANIDSPMDRSTISEGVATTIQVTANDDAGISNVVFKANGVEFSQDNTAPYSADFTPASLGAVSTHYTIEVVVTDDGGLTGADTIVLNAADPSFTFLSTAVGNGADAEVYERDSPNDNGRDGPDLNSRFSGTTRNEIIALRFDLTGVDRSQMNDLSLVLVEYRSGNNTTDRAIYGVEPGATPTSGANTVNTWADTNILFSTMPGLDWDGDPTTRGLNATNTTLLLQDLSNSGSEWAKAIWGGTALTDFIKNYGGDQVTLLVAQDPDVTSGGQFRIASKEAGSLASITGSVGDFAPYLAFRLAAPVLNWQMVGNNIEFSWTGSGLKLQAQTNNLSTGITGSWSDYLPGGDTSPVTVPIDAAQGPVFFRLSN